jgi:hypothetical protein
LPRAGQAKTILDKDSNGTIDLAEFMGWSEYAFTAQALAGAARNSPNSSLSVKPAKRVRRKSSLIVLTEAENEHLGQ